MCPCCGGEEGEERKGGGGRREIIKQSNSKNPHINTHSNYTPTKTENCQRIQRTITIVEL